MLPNFLTGQSSFIKRVGTNALANIVSKAQIFIVAVVLSRFFSVQEFASFGVILTVIGLVSVFAAVGLGPAVVRFVAKEPDISKRNVIASSALGVNALLSVVLCSILFFSVNFIEAELGYVIDGFDVALRLICPGIFLLLLSQVCISFLNGLQRFDLVAKCQIIVALISLPLQLGLSFVYGLYGFSLGFLISNLLLFVTLTYCILGDRLLTAFEFNWLECKQLLAFSLPSFLSGIWPMPLMAFAFWTISHHEEAALQAAILTSANQVFAVLYFLPVMVAQVLMPKVASQQNESEQSLILSSLLRKLIPAILVLTVLLGLISPIFPWLFDFEIQATIWVFIAVILTVAIVSVQTQIDHFNVGSGRVWLHFWLNAFWGCIFLAAILYMDIWGALGIVLARLLAYFARSILLVFYFPSPSAVRNS